MSRSGRRGGRPVRIGDPHDHVAPTDPRYDGHRIERLWAVTGVDPADDQEGVLHVDARAGLRGDELVGCLSPLRRRTP